MVMLGEVLAQTGTQISPDPSIEYSEITVRISGKGIVERRRVSGSEINGRRFVARSGNFILSRIDARHGAMGLVPGSLDGALVTNDFPLFRANSERLDLPYLGWLCRTPDFVDLCARASEGTTNRVRLKEERFLALEIPLPPLPEQRRIVARIEALAAEIDEAKRLRREAVEEAGALGASYLGSFFESLATQHDAVSLESVTTNIIDGPHVTPQYLPDGMGVPFVTVKNMVTGKLDFSVLRYVSHEDHEIFSRRCKAERGDVLYSKDGATRGRPCFVDTDREFSYFVSVALIKPIRDLLDGRYLCHILNSRWITDRMTEKSRGDMIPHIVLGEIRAFPIPLPPLPEQRRIVAELDALQAEVDALKRLQSETAAELDALLPAILDRAFKGEL